MTIDFPQRKFEELLPEDDWKTPKEGTIVEANESVRKERWNQINMELAIRNMSRLSGDMDDYFKMLLKYHYGEYSRTGLDREKIENAKRSMNRMIATLQEKINEMQATLSRALKV